MLRINLRCVQVVWVFILSESLSSAGPPAPPSQPHCFIPCDESCGFNILCTWEPEPDPTTPTNYTLHWESADTKGGHTFHGSRVSGSIPREHFNRNVDLRVWVQAENQQGSAKSPETKFNTEKIFKPAPPVVRWDPQEPLEITWTSGCTQLKRSLGLCDVRYQAVDSQDWIQGDSYHSSFSFDSLQACSLHLAQVRCACSSGLKSDWSELKRITPPGTAPVGELDLWRDCGLPPHSTDCHLTWKKLPTSQACGDILGYEVTLTHLDGSVDFMNVSTADHSDLLVCEEVKCHLNSSLKGMSSVNVSAFNAHGIGAPSHLSVSVTGEGRMEKDPHMNMTEVNLTVSWTDISVPSDSVKEYVVQYKEAGRPLGQGLDWVRVSNGQTSAVFKGHFQKYKPYKVSLFTVSHSNVSSGPSSVRHLSSAVGYSLQGVPPRVPSFKLVSNSDSPVKVSWEPIPLEQQSGTIQFYQIGVKQQDSINSFSVLNVSSSQTFHMVDVKQGEVYEVWIRAVTKAGPGEKTTLTINLPAPPDIALLSLVVVAIFLVTGLVSVALLCFCPGTKTACSLMRFCGKVPDPGNSNILKQMKHQMNESSGLICFPLCEPHPNISRLEVVEIQTRTPDFSRKETSDSERQTRPSDRDRSLQTDRTEDQRVDTGDDRRTDSKYRTEAYSKIIDSEDEGEGNNGGEGEGEGNNGGEGEGEGNNGGEGEGNNEGELQDEDCWSSSEEGLLESGYEKHFMPSAREILEVL
ncbi:interleukin 12 receptor%2C beta 2a, like isoform X1 [Xyrichtys novacula]|uniref:Interleukin 12 receptor, beta 2a, like isoform X1 n=1 Tax=Xyrichtys novacula TaxID=13765 RepID=A0AAV1GV84_XYRNO|nr:interleukin 12 receptor%2C beta 2a, like isoform X1 [Xyrichtys novacula]